MAALEKKNLATFFFNTMFLKTGAPPTILTSLFFFDRDNKKRASPDVRFYVIMKKFS